MSTSATPATQSIGRCRQVPRLPRKQPQRPKYPSAPPVQCHKRHACHAECRSMSPRLASMSPSATPGTQTAATRASPVPLPRRMHVDVAKCHACHANAVSVTKCHAWHANSVQCHKCHLTQSEGQCHQVPHLPRKVTVDAAKSHACHANSRGDQSTQAATKASPVP